MGSKRRVVLLILCFIQLGILKAQNHNKLDFNISYPFKPSTNEEIELFKEEFAHYGDPFPKIVYVKENKFVVYNPYLKPGDHTFQIFDSGLTEKIFLPEIIFKSKLIQEVGLDFNYQNSTLKQLNFYGNIIYFLYANDSDSLTLIRYKKNDNCYKVIRRIKDIIRFKKYSSNIKILVNNDNLLISNDVINKYIAIDLRNIETIYVNNIIENTLKGLGINNNIIYFINPYTLELFYYENSELKILKKIEDFPKYFKNNSSISFFMNYHNNLLYISFFDYKSFKLISYCYPVRFHAE